MRRHIYSLDFNRTEPALHPRSGRLFEFYRRIKVLSLQIYQLLWGIWV